jgi:hypothetical protein
MIIWVSFKDWPLPPVTCKGGGGGTISLLYDATKYTLYMHYTICTVCPYMFSAEAEFLEVIGT